MIDEPAAHTGVGLNNLRTRLRILHVAGETHIMRRTLSELERDLGADRFIRIHCSIIANLERIHGMEMRETGEYDVILKSKVRVRSSRRFRKRLQDRLDATRTIR